MPGIAEGLGPFGTGMTPVPGEPTDDVWIMRARLVVDKILPNVKGEAAEALSFIIGGALCASYRHGYWAARNGGTG